MDLGGVRAQPQMLWGEDLGPETPVDNPDNPQSTRPESSQDLVDGSSDSDEEEWKYVRGNSKTSDKEKMDDSLVDKKSQLNPNASEFVPGFPSVEKDEFIASSPNIDKVMSKDLDDIVVPSESEFNRDISTKACELEAASDDPINTSAEPSSRREIDFNYSADEVVVDNVTLILTPQKSESNRSAAEQKADTNPFTADIESSKDDADRVSFVQDYFGKSELDFKPFESVTPHFTHDKICEEDQNESQIPNSVSAEISSHFNFIESHLDNGETERPEESEKERNQLEIKEPESPVNSEDLNSGVIVSVDQKNESKSLQVDDKVDLLVNEFESHRIDDSQPPETEMVHLHESNEGGNVEEMIAEASSDHFSSESDKMNIIETEDMFRFDNQEDMSAPINVEIHKISNEIIPELPGKEAHQDDKESFAKIENVVLSNFSKECDSINFMEEIRNDIPHSEHLGKGNEFSCEPTEETLKGNADDKNEPYATDKMSSEFSRDHVPCSQIETSPFEIKEICNSDEVLHENDEAKLINDSTKVTYEILDAPTDLYKIDALNESEKELSANCENMLHDLDPTEHNSVVDTEFVSEHVNEFIIEQVLCDPGFEQVLCDAEPEHVQCDTELVLDLDERKGNITDMSSEKNIEPPVELADTIGPNSFSFSQPHEAYGSSMTPMEFMANRYGTTDIMMTSMHESLEPDSSFEFINECSVKDSNIIEVNNKELQDCILTSTAVSEPLLEAQENIARENGVDHIESSEIIPTEIVSIKTDSLMTPSDMESVVVESHEVPVCREPDVVFVEQICPTVEVSSDEASPISKENSSFDLATTAITAASITVAGAGAAAVVDSFKSDEKMPELSEKEIKVGEDAKTAVKPAASKAPVTKKPAPTGAKPTASKTSSTKAAPTKTAAPALAKPKTPATTKPTATLTKKPATFTAKPSMTATTRTAPLSKPAVKTSAAPISKVSAKPPLSSTKPTARPTSAPSKAPAPLPAKPLLSARTTATAPKASLAAKKPMAASTLSPKPLANSRPASAAETKSTKPAAPRTTSLAATKPAVPKTAALLATKPPAKLGLSAAPTAKPKTTSTKPAPIKAKAPLTGSKKPAAPSAKKTSAVLDKNTKNAVKSVPREAAQKEISTKENKEGENHESSTTNGHHIENGNVTPHEEIASPIII